MNYIYLILLEVEGFEYIDTHIVGAHSNEERALEIVIWLNDRLNEIDKKTFLYTWKKVKVHGYI